MPRAETWMFLSSHCQGPSPPSSTLPTPLPPGRWLRRTRLQQSSLVAESHPLTGIQYAVRCKTTPGDIRAQEGNINHHSQSGPQATHERDEDPEKEWTSGGRFVSSQVLSPLPSADLHPLAESFTDLPWIASSSTTVTSAFCCVRTDNLTYLSSPLRGCGNSLGSRAKIGVETP